MGLKQLGQLLDKDLQKLKDLTGYVDPEEEALQNELNAVD